MKTLISWLGDVYQRNGYVAVLVAVAVIVGLALLVASVGGVSLGGAVQSGHRQAGGQAVCMTAHGKQRWQALGGVSRVQAGAQAGGQRRAVKPAVAVGQGVAIVKHGQAQMAGKVSRGHARNPNSRRRDKSGAGVAGNSRFITSSAVARAAA